MSVSTVNNVHFQNLNTDQSKLVGDKPSFVWKASLSALGGAAGGYIAYWSVRMFENGSVKSASPYILSGIFASVTREALELAFDVVHQVALKILGERAKYEGGLNKKGLVGHVRTYSWVVIKQTEGVVYRIDRVSSKVLKVRTMKEIKESKITDRDLKAIELIRKLALEQVKDTFLDVSSYKIGMITTAALGFPLIGAEALVFMATFGFIFGLAMKYNEAQRKIAEEKQAERIKLKEEKIRYRNNELLSIVENPNPDTHPNNLVDNWWQPSNPENPLLYHSIDELTAEELQELKDKNLLERYIQEAEPKEYPAYQPLKIANVEVQEPPSPKKWKWRWC